MTAISHPFIAGHISGDLDGMSVKLCNYIRKRAGRRCVVWVSELGDVTISPAGSAPDFGDDIAPMVGVYLHKPGEISWRESIREALIEQARGMKVAA